MARRSYEFSSAFQPPKVNMKALEKKVFKRGAKIEISIDEDNFRGAWFTGFVRSGPAKNGKTSVQFDHLIEDDDSKIPIKESVDTKLLRPIAPRERVRRFKLNEEVDLDWDDGWWQGVVTEVHEDEGKYSVFLRPSKELYKVDASKLRLHREWLYGQWIPPLEEEEEEAPAAGGEEAAAAAAADADDDGDEEDDDDEDDAGGGGDEAGGSGTK